MSKGKKSLRHPSQETKIANKLSELDEWSSKLNMEMCCVRFPFEKPPK